MYILHCPNCDTEIPTTYELRPCLECPHCGYVIFDDDSVSLEISEIERLDKKQKKSGA